MTPEEVTALRCARCGHLYGTTRLAREQAEECCTCKNCGGSDGLTGWLKLCRVCDSIEGLQKAREALERAKGEVRMRERWLRDAEAKGQVPRPTKAVSHG